MKKQQSALDWILVIGWMGVIFYLSHQPASISSELSSSITERLLRLIETVIPFVELERSLWHFFIRKMAHFTAYFILGILLMNALRKGRSIEQQVYLTFIISFLYAVSDEIHQLFIPGRSGEVRDVLIDTFGAMTGVFFYQIFMKMFLKKSKF